MIFDDRNQYTISVRWIVESYSQETPEISTDRKIAIALPQIFNFDFPIYSEAYRTEFEEKLVRHFYFHEINITSIGAWKFQLREKLNLIMPVYNKMYEAIAIKYDPLIDTQMHETYTRTNNLTSNSSTQGDVTQNDTSQNQQVYSDLPQTTLHGGDYATNSTQNDGAATSEQKASQTANAKSDNTETYEHNNTGFSSRSQQGLLMEYYESLRNVDEMIFNELRELFMLIY